jgi:hypothetical protein
MITLALVVATISQLLPPQAPSAGDSHMADARVP